MMMQTPVEMRPENFSRRGEITAWVLAILALVSWFSLYLRDDPAPVFLILLTFFLIFAAIAISLSNWSDRHTVLRIEPDGVIFENGLRRVHFNWDEISTIQIFPSNLGDRVRVTGGGTFFTFRLLGEVRLHGQIRGRMGFADGERILRHILLATGLKRFDKTGEGYYYARE